MIGRARPPILPDMRGLGRWSSRLSEDVVRIVGAADVDGLSRGRPSPIWVVDANRESGSFRTIVMCSVRNVALPDRIRGKGDMERENGSRRRRAVHSYL
jgi:hypothetical protein